MKPTKLSMEVLYQIAAACVAVVAVLRTWRFVNWAIIKPKRTEKLLRKQGLNGNAYRLLIGDYLDMAQARQQAHSKPINLDDDIKPRALPYPSKTIHKYGYNSFYWQGPKATVVITDPAHIKQVTNKLKVYHKMEILDPLAKLFAPGLVSLEDDEWAKHRQLAAPAFHQDKLKLMVPAFRESCKEVLEKWEKVVTPNGSGEIDAWPYLKSLTFDAISRTAFGSSYRDGKNIFELQQELSELVLKNIESLYIPGFRFLPTKSNKRIKEIENEVRSRITGIINKRIEKCKAGNGDDDNLLSILVESNLKEIELRGHKSFGMTIDQIVDECKVFYFGGQDTTSTWLASTVFFLSRYPDWQTKARQEVISVFGNQPPSFDGINNLKIVTMILQEVLRLYPPVVALDRHCMEDTKLGELTIPGGVHILIPLIYLHHSREIWGDDALEFNPQRFSEGMAKAQKGEGMYFPFGWGPRICIGQNFAYMEAKVVLSMILQHFSFELSPSYTHAPHTIFTMQPQHGLHVILHKL